ncbi:MAG: hypothetical protein LUO96_01740, partial [Methanomicrobiales archaeon]|nr:hypothetical protein [Methanomicrobiales archaeon]
VVAMAVAKGDEIIVMSSSGNVMRTRVSEISIQKRNTRGVRIMNLEEGDRVVGVAIVRPEMNGENGTPAPASPPCPVTPPKDTKEPSYRGTPPRF